MTVVFLKIMSRQKYRLNAAGWLKSTYFQASRMLTHQLALQYSTKFHLLNHAGYVLEAAIWS